MRVAILGATGAVGRTMVERLASSDLPVEELVLLASSRSRGTRLSWRGRECTVEEPCTGVFEGCRLALFSAGAQRSRDWAPRAAAEGAIVVDNSSAWRMDEHVPLVVPEVNADRIAARPRGIIANPNCVTIQLVVVLEALRRAAGLRRVSTSTYQAVSGAGQDGVRALEAELAGRTLEASPFPARIAGNVIPAIGPRDEAGWNEEEVKVREETQKILGLPELPVSATCVRVPVEVGHAMTVEVETERELSVEEARAAFADMPGIARPVATTGSVDPLPSDVAGRDEIQVGRLRKDPDFPNVLHMWIVGDNLRKGAATNAVQIAERILRG